MFSENLIINKKEISYQGTFDDKNIVDVFVDEFKSLGYNIIKKEKNVSGSKIEQELVFIKEMRIKSWMDKFEEWLFNTKRGRFIELKIRTFVDEDSKKKIIDVLGKKIKVREGKINITSNGFVVDKRDIEFAYSGVRMMIGVAFQNLVNMGNRFSAENELRSNVNKVYKVINAELQLNKYKFKS